MNYRTVFCLLFLMSVAFAFTPSCDLGGDYTLTQNNSSCGNISTNGFTFDMNNFNFTTAGDVVVNGSGGVFDARDGTLVTGSLTIAEGATFYGSIEELLVKDVSEVTNYTIDCDGNFIGQVDANITFREGTEDYLLDINCSDGYIPRLLLDSENTVGHFEDDSTIVDFQITNGTLYPTADTNHLNMTGLFRMANGTFGLPSWSGSITARNIDIQSENTVTLPSGVVTLTGEGPTSGVVWRSQPGAVLNHNGGTVHIITPASTAIFEKSTGNLNNIIINGSNDVRTAHDFYLDGNLTIVDGTFRVEYGDNNANSSNWTININQDVVINTGSTFGNGQAGNNYFGSLTIDKGGTYDATNGTTFITNETIDGFAFQNHGTFTNNRGVLNITTQDDTLIDFNGSGTPHTFGVDLSNENRELVYNTTVTLTGDLVVGNATFTAHLNEAAVAFNVDGNVTVTGNGTLNFTADASNASHSIGSLTVEDRGTYVATSETTTVTGDTVDDYSFDIESGGTFVGSNGLFSFNFTGLNYMSALGTGNLYDVMVGSTNLKWLTDITIDNDFTVDSGMQAQAAADTGDDLTVTGDVDLYGDLGRGGGTENNNHQFGSLTIRFGGVYDATSANTTLKGNFDNYGSFLNRDGLFKFSHTADTNINLNGDIEPVFYDLENANTGSSSDLVFRKNTTVENVYDMQSSANGRGSFITGSAVLTMGSASGPGTIIATGSGNKLFFMGSSGSNKLYGFSDANRAIIDESVVVSNIMNDFNDVYLKWVQFNQNFTADDNGKTFFIEGNTAFMTLDLQRDATMVIMEGAEVQFLDTTGAGFDFSDGTLIAYAGSKIVSNETTAVNRWEMVGTWLDINIANASIRNGNNVGSYYQLVGDDLGDNTAKGFVFNNASTTLIRPADATNLYVPNKVLFEWGEVFNASSYELKVWNSTDEVLSINQTTMEYEWDTTDVIADTHSWEVITTTGKFVAPSTGNRTFTLNAKGTAVTSNYNAEQEYMFNDIQYDVLNNDTFLYDYGGATTENTTISIKNGHLFIEANSSADERGVVVGNFHMIPVSTLEFKYNDSEMAGNDHFRVRLSDDDSPLNTSRKMNNFYIDVYPNHILIPVFVTDNSEVISNRYEHRRNGDVHTIRMDYNGVTKNLTYYVDGFKVYDSYMYNNFGNESQFLYDYSGFSHINIRPFAEMNLSIDYIKQYGNRSLITPGVAKLGAVGFDAGFTSSSLPLIFDNGIASLDAVGAVCTMFPTVEDMNDADWSVNIANLTARGWEIDIHGESRYLTQEMTNAEAMAELTWDKQMIINNITDAPKTWTPLSGDFNRTHLENAWIDLDLMQRELIPDGSIDKLSHHNLWLNMVKPGANRNYAVFMHKINVTGDYIDGSAGGVPLDVWEMFIYNSSSSGYKIVPYWYFYKSSMNQYEMNITNLDFQSDEYSFDLDINEYPGWVDIIDHHSLSDNYSVVFAYDSAGNATTLESAVPHVESGSFELFALNTSTYKIVNMTIETSDSFNVTVHTRNTTYQSWTVTSTNAAAEALHSIPGFTANKNYTVEKNGAIFGSFRSDANGVVSFNYDDGFSTVLFEMYETAIINFTVDQVSGSVLEDESISLNLSVYGQGDGCIWNSTLSWVSFDPHAVDLRTDVQNVTITFSPTDDTDVGGTPVWLNCSGTIKRLGVLLDVRALGDAGGSTGGGGGGTSSQVGDTVVGRFLTVTPSVIDAQVHLEGKEIYDIYVKTGFAGEHVVSVESNVPWITFVEEEAVMPGPGRIVFKAVVTGDHEPGAAVGHISYFVNDVVDVQTRVDRTTGETRLVAGFVSFAMFDDFMISEFLFGFSGAMITLVLMLMLASHFYDRKGSMKKFYYVLFGIALLLWLWGGHIL